MPNIAYLVSAPPIANYVDFLMINSVSKNNFVGDELICLKGGQNGTETYIESIKHGKNIDE
jgi:hypothetical protein